MSDVADDMWNEAQEWADDSVVCKLHGIHHLRRFPCEVCEDGEDFHDWIPHGSYRGVGESAVEETEDE